MDDRTKKLIKMYKPTKEQLKDFEEVEKIASKSKLTKEDAQIIGDKIKRDIAKRNGLDIN